MRDSRAVIAVQCNYCQWLIVIRAHRNYRLISRFPPPPALAAVLAAGARAILACSQLDVYR